MTENVENLIQEHLKAIRMDIASIKNRLDDPTARVTSLENLVATLLGNVLRINGRLDRIEMRMGRIEQRLDLVS
jgi:predicted  nucleic acid-binding Zn-ribbon protein